MKIVVCPADRGGCGYYRFIWPARALGIEVLAADAFLTRGYYNTTPDGDVLVDIDPVDADVVVLQRVLARQTLELQLALQARGIAVVVDVDDDFSRIEKGNTAYPLSDPVLSPERNFEILMESCDKADLVTTSTPALAGRFAPHGRVAVLPNCVPGRYLHVERHEWKPMTKVRVGWSGSIDTHPNDLAATGGGVGQAMHDLGGLASFHVIGTGKGVQHELGLGLSPTASGWMELEDYPGAVGRLDVGIVPLKACAFNRCKSWLKGLEMASVGVPFVASPTPEYERLAKLGAGLIAGNATEWYRSVCRLVRDTGLRREMAARGRDVAAMHTVEGNAWKWEAAWTQARVERRVA